jgi:hypothetical protein
MPSASVTTRLGGLRRPSETLVASACIASAVLAAVATVAASVGLGAAPATRRWLAFGFAGVPPTVAEALGIFAHNLRALGGVAGLILIAQLPWHAGTDPRALRALRSAGECLIAGLTAANVLVVGCSLGAYGARMLRALLPHAPVELAAYALALALYAPARRRRLSVTEAATALSASTALLAVAAALEVFAA